MLRDTEGFDYGGNPGVALPAGDWYLRGNSNGGGAWPNFSAGRFNGYCISWDSIGGQGGAPTPTMFKAIKNGPYTSGVIGCAVKIGSDNVAGVPYIGVKSIAQGGNQFTVAFLNGGMIQVSRGDPGAAVLAATDPGTFTMNSWFNVEFKFEVDPSAGYVTIEVNGVTVMSLITANTQACTTANFESIELGCLPITTTTNYAFDDLYFMDLTGSINNNFLGTCRINSQLMIGAGASTTFTPVGASTNWQAALNNALDDTKYDVTGTVGNIDLYEVAASINAPVIFGVQVKSALRQDDATQITARNVLRVGSTNYTGADHNTSESYQFYGDIWELNPSTSSGWTGADINTIEVGPKLTAIA